MPAVVCPHCESRFKVSDEVIGRKGKCAKCQGSFKLEIAKADEFAVVDSGQVKKKPRLIDEDVDLDKLSKKPNKKFVESKTPISQAGKRKTKVKQTKSGAFTLWASMGAGLTLCLIVLAVVLSGVLPNSSGADQGKPGVSEVVAESPKVYETEIQPFMKKYCYDCHCKDNQEGGIDLSQFATEESVLKKRKTWEHAFDMLRIGAMPPADSDLPADEEKKKVLTWLENKLFHLDCKLVDNPGRVTIRRLNRAEYNNTMRDLMYVDIKPADKFPVDEVGYGFDTIGDVLTLSPLLVERYLDAAELVTSAAITTPEQMQKMTTLSLDKAKREGGVVDYDSGLMCVSWGKISLKKKLPQTGDYELIITATGYQAGDQPATMEVFLNDKSYGKIETKGNKEVHDYPVKIKCDNTECIVSIVYLNDFYEERKGKSPLDRNLAINNVSLKGPLLGEVTSQSASHKNLIFAKPGKDKSPQAAAKEVLTKFMTRAFRRSVAEDEVSKYLALFNKVVSTGDSYERGIQVAMQGILVSPHFIYRVEDTKLPQGPTIKLRITDEELASRMSYFIWSSMPDDELLALAEQKKLSEPQVLEAQVRRMLKDPKSLALVQNFAGQWLGLRKLDEVDPDNETFPMYNEKLKKSMWRETELFFEVIKNEDRSVLDFLDGEFTFVNESLAKLYGIDNIKGDEFQRVSLRGSNRAGILTHASILTHTSYPTRTSPVKRGEWILGNVMGQPPPPAPPVVPDFEVTMKNNPNLPLRKQLEIHRKDPGCASCHRVMDSIGFGFENFDAIGRWREKEGENPIDASGQLPGGETFNTPRQLVTLLRAQKDSFVRCLIEKMMTFSMGRGVEYYDRCAIDKILHEMQNDQYRFSRLVVEIVNSDPFCQRSGMAQEKEEP